jgi:hypothetical protein
MTKIAGAVSQRCGSGSVGTKMSRIRNTNLPVKRDFLYFYLDFGTEITKRLWKIIRTWVSGYVAGVPGHQWRLIHGLYHHRQADFTCPACQPVQVYLLNPQASCVRLVN